MRKRCTGMCVRISSMNKIFSSLLGFALSVTSRWYFSAKRVADDDETRMKILQDSSELIFDGMVIMEPTRTFSYYSWLTNNLEKTTGANKTTAPNSSYPYYCVLVKQLGFTPIDWFLLIYSIRSTRSINQCCLQ